MRALCSAAVELLDAEDDHVLSERDLVSALKGRGFSMGVKSVRRALDGDDRLKQTSVWGKPAWTFAEGADIQRGPVRDSRPDLRRPVVTGDPFDGMTPRGWQITAFGKWAANGCSGVIEAMTGTGKTYVALMAVRVALSKNGRVLVLVPTTDLQTQWVRELRRNVPDARIGKLGGGGDADLYEHHVVVATMTSGGRLEVEPPPGHLGLLVSDEAHRVAADTFSQALRDPFAMRLALTATLERNDDGVERVIGPYFGPTVFAYGYADAAADEVIARFSVALVESSLTERERDEYDAADGAVRQWRRELIDHGLPKHPLRMIDAAAKLAAEGEGRPNRSVSREIVAARSFLSALRKRRDVAATAGGKMETLRALAPHLRERKVLVFTDTVSQAYDARDVLVDEGVVAEEIHSGLTDRKRRIRLAQFANDSDLDCVVAPRVLDEGVDVPDADVAVVLASFASRRQMVQRLGRVLRRTDDDKVARLIVVSAGGTREDPEGGAHADFLEEVFPVAESVDRFGPDPTTDELEAVFGE